jgi:hypothetical protein
MICQYCPTNRHYVDRTPTMGVAHTYSVAAVFPSGVSKRVMSNTVTPGAIVATSDAATDTTTPAQTSGVLSGIMGGLTSEDKKPASVNAVTTSGTSVRVSWTPPPSKTDWVKSYAVMRRVGRRPLESVGTANRNTRELDDRFFPSTMFSSGPVRVTYQVYALGDGDRVTSLTPNRASNEVEVSGQNTAGGSGTVASESRGSACTLEYRRADNMWAAKGRADGNLGTESITLNSGTNRVFTTDWAYEKQRSDGNSYFGSHLRIARNTAAGVLRLHLRSADLGGLIRLSQTGKSR